jgi:four helix bundle protein
MRRAAVSIPSNIAEGQGRWSRRENRQFVFVARGSAYEIDTQLAIAEDLGYLDTDTAADLVARTNEVTRLLNNLARSLTDS